MSEDKRSQQRRRVLKDGSVLLPGSRVTYDCAIRDMNESGAKFRLKIDSITLPSEFELIFVSEGTAYPARLMWQRGSEAGVMFDGPPRSVKVRIY